MKIGINMHLWGTSIDEPQFATIEELRAIGYDGIEIFLADPDPAIYRRVGAFCESVGMEVNGCLGLGPEADPISSDKSVQAKALDTLKVAIDNVHLAGGKNICGPFHSAYAQFSHDVPHLDELQRSAQVLREAAEYAAQAGVTLTPEALNRFECYLVNTMEQLRTLVEMVDHPNLRGMFDSHHANIEEKSFSAAIDTIAPVLGHVHISENDRGTPGGGLVSWDEVFSKLSKLDYNGWYTIEAFSRDDVAFANAIHVWRDYNPRMDICRDGYQFVKEMLEKYNKN